MNCHKTTTTNIAATRINDRKRIPNRNRRINGIAAISQNVNPRFRGERMNAGNHAVISVGSFGRRRTGGLLFDRRGTRGEQTGKQASRQNLSHWRSGRYFHAMLSCLIPLQTSWFRLVYIKDLPETKASFWDRFVLLFCAFRAKVGMVNRVDMSEQSGTPLTLQELPELRRKTEAVSRLLRDQITAHLETLRPLFAPERVFGKYAGGKLEVSGADRSLSELQQQYKPFTAKPYDLPETLDQNWLTLVGNALELHPWEYAYQAQGKTITMSSPVRWVINFRASYTLAQVKSTLAGKETVRQDYLRQFAVNTLVLQLILKRNPGLAQLFHDLRYELKTETSPDLKGLPIVTVTSCLSSFRPADDLILAATAFSGVPTFIELLDLNSVRDPHDPLAEKLKALLQ